MTTKSKFKKSQICHLKKMSSNDRDRVKKQCRLLLGGSKELGFFMSQCRKNSARGKGIDKKRFIRTGNL